MRVFYLGSTANPAEPEQKRAHILHTIFYEYKDRLACTATARSLYNNQNRCTDIVIVIECTVCSNNEAKVILVELATVSI